jgi:cytochrome b involved in lipid metabolism
VLFFVFSIIIEVGFRFIAAGETAFNEPQNIITNEEFKKRVTGGEKLCILDDLVLDISKFKDEHPGGTFVL